MHEWPHSVVDRFNSDRLDVLQSGTNRIDGGEVRHPDREAGSTGLALDVFKPVRAESILQVVPASRRNSPFLRPGTGHTDQPAAVAGENPLVRAADNQVSSRQIERDTP